MMTPEQYEASLRKMNFKVYLQGDKPGVTRFELAHWATT